MTIELRKTARTVYDPHQVLICDTCATEHEWGWRDQLPVGWFEVSARVTDEPTTSGWVVRHYCTKACLEAVTQAWVAAVPQPA